jgi:hypothetical protein
MAVLRKIAFVITTLASIALSHVALAQSAPPNMRKMAPDFTNSEGTTFKGLRPKVIGTKCIADYSTSNPKWPKPSYRTQAEWDASKRDDGGVNCTNGKWANAETGNSGPWSDIVIIKGSAFK